MLGVSWHTIRLFLHVLAATVWVGGQLTLAALVPVLRRAGATIPAAAARRFSLVAWPAFGVLILTGIWNVVAVRSRISGQYETTLIVKLVLVLISGLTAALHARARQERARGLRRPDGSQRARRPVPRRAARRLACGPAESADAQRVRRVHDGVQAAPGRGHRAVPVPQPHDHLRVLRPRP